MCTHVVHLHPHRRAVTLCTQPKPQSPCASLPLQAVRFIPPSVMERAEYAADHCPIRLQDNWRAALVVLLVGGDMRATFSQPSFRSQARSSWRAVRQRLGQPPLVACSPCSNGPSLERPVLIAGWRSTSDRVAGGPEP
jgi:hypothetical protein